MQLAADLAAGILSGMDVDVGVATDDGLNCVVNRVDPDRRPGGKDAFRIAKPERHREIATFARSAQPES